MDIITHMMILMFLYIIGTIEVSTALQYKI